MLPCTTILLQQLIHQPAELWCQRRVCQYAQQIVCVLRSEAAGEACGRTRACCY